MKKENMLSDGATAFELFRRLSKVLYGFIGAAVKIGQIQRLYFINNKKRSLRMMGDENDCTINQKWIDLKRKGYDFLQPALGLSRAVRRSVWKMSKIQIRPKFQTIEQVGHPDLRPRTSKTFSKNKIKLEIYRRRESMWYEITSCFGKRSKTHGRKMSKCGNQQTKIWCSSTKVTKLEPINL